MGRERTFVPKQNQVKALQHIGGPEDITITDFSRFSGFSSVKVIEGGAVVITPGSGSLTLNIGDWLVLEEEVIQVIPDETFKAKYVAI